MEELKKKLVDYFITNKIVQEEKRAILRYGSEIIISSTLTIGLCLVISGIIGQLVLCIVFLLTYCPLRIFSGGFHAKTQKKCTFLFIILVMLNIFISGFISEESYILNTFKWIAILIVLILSPVGCIENPISFELKKKMKVKASFCLGLEVFAIEFFKEYNYEIANCASCALIALAFILIAGILNTELQKKKMTIEEVKD